MRSDPGGQPQAPVPWVAVITYRFSGEAMSSADRLINPLGFQVLRYRKDAETLPDPAPVPAQASAVSGTLPQAPAAPAAAASPAPQATRTTP